MVSNKSSVNEEECPGLDLVYVSALLMTREHEEDDSRALKDGIRWLTALALDPGSTPDDSHAAALKRIRISLATKVERRATKYSLRPHSRPTLQTTVTEHRSPSSTRKRARVGDDFQAEVPSKPRAAPYKDEESMMFMGTVWHRREYARNMPVGCFCVDKRSADCVRLHIQETRSKLELELGENFAACGLHKMGEVVARSWSPEEERTFKAVFVELKGTGEVWKRLRQVFPDKTQPDLVSYYFNVFMLRRRAVQNRIALTPDSDDDEQDLPDDTAQREHELVIVL